MIIHFVLILLVDTAHTPTEEKQVGYCVRIQVQMFMNDLVCCLDKLLLIVNVYELI